MIKNTFLCGCLIGLALQLTACGSSYRARQAERDKVALSSGLYCEFLNGDAHNDIDVELNLNMAKKCDITKHYSISNYKNASDIYGMVYCCATGTKTLGPAAPSNGVTAPTDKKAPATSTKAGAPAGGKDGDF